MQINRRRRKTGCFANDGYTGSRTVAGGKDKLVHLEEELAKRVIGQSEAVKAVASSAPSARRFKKTLTDR